VGRCVNTRKTAYTRFPRGVAQQKRTQLYRNGRKGRRSKGKRREHRSSQNCTETLHTDRGQALPLSRQGGELKEKVLRGEGRLDNRRNESGAW